MNGASTNPDFGALAYAGTQVKNALDATIKLGGENYVFWGGREGYMTLLNTALLAHGRTIFDPQLQVASLDHALWFHSDAWVDDWLLFAQESPISGQARALTRGQIFSRAGALVASVAQEGLIRLRDK
jgi:hypothetical protein